MILYKQNVYYNELYQYQRNIPKEYLDAFKNWVEEKNKKMEEKKIFSQQNPNIKDANNGANSYEFISYHMKLITMDIIINKSFSFKCIETHKIIRTNRCFHLTFQNEQVQIKDGLDDIIVYIFDEIDNPFFVCIGGGGWGSALSNEILMVYYFKSNKIYSFNEDVLISNEAKINLCNKIYNHYNSNAIIGSDKIFTTYGYLSNMGHVYWNELSAFKFLVDLDLLKFIDQFIIGPYDHYNIHEYLKKNKHNVVYENKIENICNLSNNSSLLFKLNDKFMYEDLSLFILDNNKLIDENELNHIENVKTSFYPIITFNIRTGYRHLNNQEIALSSLINALLLLFPNMFVIFDGYVKNKTVNLDCYSTHGYAFNESEFDKSFNKVVNSIINHIQTKNYISLIGSALDRQLAWLNISQYGLLQTGSGGTNYGWLLNKKYISVGRNPVINEELLLYVAHDFCYVENKDFSTYINPSLISFEINDKKEFEIDWRVILVHMIRDLMILEKHNYKLTQVENFQKYNIYMNFRLDNIINLKHAPYLLSFDKNIYDVANKIKYKVNRM
jgi:hypothetical protein